MSTGAEAEMLGRARTAILWDGVFARLMDAVTGGVFLAGLALHLGADSLLIGVLASLPFFAQVAQFPTVKLLLHVQDRKAVTIAFVSIGRLTPFIIAISLLTGRFLTANTLVLLIAFWSTMGVVATGAWNWWVRDTIPRDELGRYFGRRMRFTSASAALALVVTGVLLDGFIDRGMADAGYALLFLFGGIFGLASDVCLLLTPHRPPAGEPRSSTGATAAILRSVLDPRNRRMALALSLVSVTMAAALPFTAVYLLRSIQYTFVLVTALSLVSLVAYVASLRAWGHLSDRYGNPPVMQISMGMLVLALVGWGVSWGQSDRLLFALFVVVHFLSGFALGGLELTAANILLKTAPAQGAPAYLAALSLTRATAAGLATLAAGAAWQALGYETLFELQPIDGLTWSVRGFHVLALASAATGLLALLVLPRIPEEGRAEVRHVALAMRRETRALSSVAGIRAFVHVVSYVVEFLAEPPARPRANRRPPKTKGSPEAPPPP